MKTLTIMLAHSSLPACGDGRVPPGQIFDELATKLIGLFPDTFLELRPQDEPQAATEVTMEDGSSHNVDKVANLIEHHMRRWDGMVDVSDPGEWERKRYYLPRPTPIEVENFFRHPKTGPGVPKVDDKNDARAVLHGMLVFGMFAGIIAFASIVFGRWTVDLDSRVALEQQATLKAWQANADLAKRLEDCERQQKKVKTK